MIHLFKRLWSWISGFGPCFLCSKKSTLSWLKMSWRDPANERSLEFMGWLCPDCFKVKMAKWSEFFDSIETEAMNSVSQGFKDMADAFKKFSK